MRIEDRLHEALHEYADTIEPEPGSWARIEARFDETPAPRRPSHHRPLLLAGVALAVVVVVLVAGLLVRDDDDDAHRVATRQVPLPSRILAITTTGRPVVLDSTTGRQQTGYDVAGIGDTTQVAVSPDGQDAYVVQGDGNKGCDGHTVLRLPVGPGARGGDQVAANAADPTVSPDGRYLAYTHCSPEARGRADHIVLRDLATGEERITQAPAGTFFINRLEFAADSRHVLFGLYDDGDRRDTLRELDVVAGEAPPGRIVDEAGVAWWVAIRGRTGESLGVSSASPSVKVMQGRSSVTTGPLFTLPNSPTQVVSDRSGRHILSIADHTLYRWNQGEKSPTRIADGVIAAAWIPDPVRADDPTGSAVMPGGVLAVIGGQRISLLDSESGQEHESLATATGISGVSASADGRQIVFAHDSGLRACGDASPQLDRLDPATHATTRVGGRSDLPAVSPDGRWVAYGLWCDGSGPGFTNLVTDESYRTAALGSTISEADANIESTEMLGWSPDATWLLYRLGLTGDPAPHYYVGRLWPAVRQAETEVIPLPGGKGVLAGTFLDDETVALAVTAGSESSGAPTEVRTRKVRTGTTGEPPVLFELAARITSLVADPSGRHLLAVTRDGALYRWSRGDAQATKLADGVTAAAWYPGS